MKTNWQVLCKTEDDKILAKQIIDIVLKEERTRVLKAIEGIRKWCDREEDYGEEVADHLLKELFGDEDGN